MQRPNSSGLWVQKSAGMPMVLMGNNAMFAANMNMNGAADMTPRMNQQYYVNMATQQNARRMMTSCLRIRVCLRMILDSRNLIAACSWEYLVRVVNILRYDLILAQSLALLEAAAHARQLDRMLCHPAQITALDQAKSPL